MNMQPPRSRLGIDDVDESSALIPAVLALYMSLQMFSNVKGNHLLLWLAGLPLVLHRVWNWTIETNHTAHLGISIAEGQGTQSQSVLLLLLDDWIRCPAWLSLLVQDLIGIYLIRSIFWWACHGLVHAWTTTTAKDLINGVGAVILRAVRFIPFASKVVDAELSKIEEKIKGMFHDDGTTKNFRLPERGLPDEELIAAMRSMAEGEDTIWKKGYVSGTVYHGEEDHLRVLNEAYALFSVSNPLHSDLWPSIRKFEAEVISMTAGLVDGGLGTVCGAVTSGGTESIILAAKTHRDWYRHEYGISHPEIIAAATAHAAIDKACDLMGIKLIKVPVDPITFKIDVRAVRRCVTANTIMLYGSAPNYPQGTIDDIEALSKLAVDFRLGLHVDCCLGGFVLPFVREMGYNIPAFDFSLAGVTSMSCDTHKYGYAAKGTSVVLYRRPEIRRYQYFVFTEWTGGLYCTPTIAGSRPGALSAACWASMMRLGRAGFMARSKEIIETAQDIRRGIEKIEGIFVLGDPKAMVVCFGSKKFNVLRVGDFMTKRGWNLNSLQHPPSIHICVTVRHVGRSKAFLNDLEESVAAVKYLPPDAINEDGSAFYGMAATMPKGPIEDILRCFTDCTLAVDPRA